MQFKRFIFHIQFAIFCYQWKLAFSLVGPHVRPAQPNEFPYLVSIMKTTGFNPEQPQLSHRCTGTLLSKQDVITAEHCLFDAFTQGFKVMVGSHDLSQATPFYPIFIWTYDRWTQFRRVQPVSRNNDMAFIKLTGNVPDNVPIAPMGNIDNHLLWGLDHIMAGWGKLDNNTVPRHLQVVTVKVLSKEDCEDRIYDLLGLTVDMDPTNICSVGNPYALLFEGDSGGPLLFFGTIVGVNVAIFPLHGGTLNPQQVNVSMGLRHYQNFITDCMHNFNVTG